MGVYVCICVSVCTCTSVCTCARPGAAHDQHRQVCKVPFCRPAQPLGANPGARIGGRHPGHRAAPLPQPQPTGSGGTRPEDTPSGQMACRQHPGHLFQHSAKTRHGFTEPEKTRRSQATSSWWGPEVALIPLNTGPQPADRKVPEDVSAPTEPWSHPEETEARGKSPARGPTAGNCTPPLHKPTTPSGLGSGTRMVLGSESAGTQHSYLSPRALSPGPPDVGGGGQEKGIAESLQVPERAAGQHSQQVETVASRHFPTGPHSGLGQAAAPTPTHVTPAPHCVPGAPKQKPNQTPPLKRLEGRWCCFPKKLELLACPAAPTRVLPRPPPWLSPARQLQRHPSRILAGALASGSPPEPSFHPVPSICLRRSHKLPSTDRSPSC